MLYLSAACIFRGRALDVATVHLATGRAHSFALVEEFHDPITKGFVTRLVPADMKTLAFASFQASAAIAPAHPQTIEGRHGLTQTPLRHHSVITQSSLSE